MNQGQICIYELSRYGAWKFSEKAVVMLWDDVSTSDVPLSDVDIFKFVNHDTSFYELPIFNKDTWYNGMYNPSKNWPICVAKNTALQTLLWWNWRFHRIHKGRTHVYTCSITNVCKSTILSLFRYQGYPQSSLFCHQKASFL